MAPAGNGGAATRVVGLDMVESLRQAAPGVVVHTQRVSGNVADLPAFGLNQAITSTQLGGSLSRAVTTHVHCRPVPARGPPLRWSPLRSDIPDLT